MGQKSWYGDAGDPIATGVGNFRKIGELWSGKSVDCGDVSSRRTCRSQAYGEIWENFRGCPEEEEALSIDVDRFEVSVQFGMGVGTKTMYVSLPLQFVKGQ
jgi:hypothetical protein